MSGAASPSASNGDDSKSKSAAASSSSSSSFLIWKCPICLDTLERPVLTTCCGQSFCDACLNAALAKTDACPMCREPLLKGKHSTTRNRALEELLSRLPESIRSSSSDQEPVDAGLKNNRRNSEHDDEHQVLIRIDGTGEEEEDDDDGAGYSNRDRDRGHWRVMIVKTLTQLRDNLRWRRLRARYLCLSSVQLRQWRHWARVHWSSLQCVFYVVLFFVFVSFLRVQEEEFADHQHRQ